MRDFIPPNTPAWVVARIGCLTASRMADVILIGRDGSPSKRREALMFELLSERMVGIATDHYVSKAMQWGLDNEPAAAAAYEAQTGMVVDLAGYIEHHSIGFFGATPDRFVGEIGAIEIKCPTTKSYLQWATSGLVPAQYRHQIGAQMACCEWLDWVDFVAFDPRITSGIGPLWIQRISRRDVDISWIEQSAIEFLEEVEARFEIMSLEEES